MMTFKYHIHAQLLSQYPGKMTYDFQKWNKIFHLSTMCIFFSTLISSTKCKETYLEETITRVVTREQWLLKFSQFHLEHHCVLDFMIPASCSYHPAAINPKLFPPGFDHFPDFFSSNDIFIAFTFEVLLPCASSKKADPSSSSIFVQGATDYAAEGAQKPSNSSLLSCLQCLRTGSYLQACAKQRKGPQIIPVYFSVKCST